MFDNQLVIQNLIGQGASSNVYMATFGESQLKVAVKIAKNDKKSQKTWKKDTLELEHHRMKMVEGHPNILKSYASKAGEIWDNEFDITDITYNVIELAENGSLANIIRHTGGLGEELTKFYFLQIWHAIMHIHSFGIAHMDIKPGNILLDKFYNAKITDFGVSVDGLQTDWFDDTIRGTKSYMAPEVSYLLSTETYDAYKADIYSLGVLLYVMLFGELPLEDEFSDTCSGYSEDSIGFITGLKYSNEVKKEWSLLSNDLQDLLGRMLSMDPDDRPTPEQILDSKWFSKSQSFCSANEVYFEMEQRMSFIKNWGINSK